MLQKQLCWSAAGEVLCSVGTDNVIYAWHVDQQASVFQVRLPLEVLSPAARSLSHRVAQNRIMHTGVGAVQVSRHAELITDIVAANHMGMFISCSMDKRVVMWSAVNRRVKAVFTGHHRGVRCLDVYESTLISGSFDCDVRTYDMQTKEPVALLKGHRFPITAVQLMCSRAAHEGEHRAVTVDESGEFRLWNIFVKVTTLHVMETFSDRSLTVAPLNSQSTPCSVPASHHVTRNARPTPRPCPPCRRST